MRNVLGFLLSVVLLACAPMALYAADDGATQPPATASIGKPKNAPTGSLNPNRGEIKCTAAVNSNGSVATRIQFPSRSHVDPFGTVRLGTGLYQVAFLHPCSDVRSVLGWFRWVQPDDLNSGAVGARYCTVADRLGDTAAVFVECFNGAGFLADTSFTITLSR